MHTNIEMYTDINACVCIKIFWKLTKVIIYGEWEVKARREGRAQLTVCCICFYMV